MPDIELQLHDMLSCPNRMYREVFQQALAEIIRLREEKDALLQGVEQLGWPCRLAELPAYTAELGRTLAQSEAELARLRKQP